MGDSVLQRRDDNKYNTTPLRIAGDGAATEISEVEQRVLAQMAHLLKAEKPYILTVVFDGQNHRIYAGVQKAFVKS